MAGFVIAKSKCGKKYVVECEQNQFVAFRISDSHKLNMGDGVIGVMQFSGEHILEDYMGQRFKVDIAVVTKNDLEARHWLTM